MPPGNIWDIANFDKLAHLFVFAVLMALTLFGFLKRKQLKTLPVAAFVVAFIVCASYGLLLEVMQGTILADRYFELYDALANSIGCIVGGALFKYRFRQ
jgi:VanZ family protein